MSSYAAPVASAYTAWWKRSIATSSRPQNTNGGATSRAGSVTAALPHTAAPCAAVALAGGLPGAPRAPRTTPPPRPAGRAEDAAHDPPAGAVPPVREVAEAGLREIVLELRDAERLRGGPRRRRRRGAVAQLRLDRARDRHRRGAEDAGDQPVADRGRGLRQGLHAVASIAAGEAAVAPRRSIRWSPTRIAFAIAVSAGFTALADGKKLVSTTYRLSTSCARQFTSSAEVCGSVPNRTVPHWCATPASGMRWSSTDQLGTIVSQPMCPISPLSFR